MHTSWLDTLDLEPTISAFGEMKEYLSNPQVWSSWLVTAIQIILALIIGRIVVKLAQKALSHMMVERERSPLKFDRRRTQTIGKLLNNIVTYTVNFILLLIVLGQLGINLGPVLAGAGVLGLAIGFGAQSLVKDVITGFFIIFEDQFGVGDVVQIGTFKGTVEEIGLRVTRIRSWSGEVHIIPNGTIQQVTNYSINNSMAVVDMTIPYSMDVERTAAVLTTILQENSGKLSNLVKAPQVLGIQTLSPTEVVIRIIAECKPNTQAGVERELRKLIKEGLEQQGVAH